MGQSTSSRSSLGRAVTQFDSSELNSLVELFRELASRSPGRHISKPDFQQLFGTIPPKLSERLFAAFDEKKTDTIDCEEFIAGLAMCSKGSVKDKVKLIFNMFDIGGNGNVSREEMAVMLSYIIASTHKILDTVLEHERLYEASVRWMEGIGLIQTERPKVADETATNTLTRRPSLSNTLHLIDTLVENAFRRFDVSGNNLLSYDEFSQWAISSPEANEFFRVILQQSTECCSRNLLDYFPIETPSDMDRVNISHELLAAEQIVQSTGRSALLGATGVAISGHLVVTNYRLLFVTSHAGYVVEVDVPLMSVYKIQVESADFLLNVTCKTFINLKIALPTKPILDKTHARLLEIISCKSPDCWFAFVHFQGLREREGDRIVGRGWNLFRCDQEYRRLGLHEEPWRISTINENWALCSTYPMHLVVPKDISDEELTKIGAFRSKGRVPSLCWKDRETGAVLARSGQPYVGLQGKRCQEDEKLVRLLNCEAQFSAKLYIVDARPHVNAVANYSKGGGVENTGYYRDQMSNERCVVEFLNVENIYTMQKSYHRLHDLCNSSTDIDWLQRLQDTAWMEHISAILRGAARIVEMISGEGSSVLVHCADGWDRTSQLVALAEVMMDPYYRTLKGIQLLIEKEWVSFGHKFAERCLHKINPNKKKFSPIFLQWVDCLWQLTLQFPTCFEFNEAFLLELMEHVFSCRFGTFLCNSLREREQAKVPKKTRSFWDHISEKAGDYKNPLFVAVESSDVFGLVSVTNAGPTVPTHHLSHSHNVKASSPTSVLPRGTKLHKYSTESEYRDSHLNSCDTPSLSPSSLSAGTGAWDITKSGSGKAEGIIHSKGTDRDGEHSSCGSSSNLSSSYQKRMFGEVASRKEDAHKSAPIPLLRSNSEFVHPVAALNNSPGEQTQVQPGRKGGLPATTSASSTAPTTAMSEDIREDPPLPPSPRVLIPDTRLRRIQLWTRYYLKGERHVGGHSYNPMFRPLDSQQWVQKLVEENLRMRAQLRNLKRNQSKVAAATMVQQAQLWKYQWQLRNQQTESVKSMVRKVLLDLANDAVDVSMDVCDMGETRKRRMRRRYNSDASEGGSMSLPRAGSETNMGRFSFGSRSSLDLRRPRSASSFPRPPSQEKLNRLSHPLKQNQFETPLWIPDSVVSQCSNCSRKFGLLNRRHHCRNCGRLFDHRCANSFIPIPELGYFQPVRVCNTCVNGLSQVRREESNSIG